MKVADKFSSKARHYSLFVIRFIRGSSGGYLHVKVVHVSGVAGEVIQVGEIKIVERIDSCEKFVVSNRVVKVTTSIKGI